MSSQHLQHGPRSFAGLVTCLANQAAVLAMQELVERLAAGPACRGPLQVLLHGLPGTGKSHLVAALADEVLRRRADRQMLVLSAAELAKPRPAPPPTGLFAPEPEHVERVSADLEATRDCDLLIIEDLQYLPNRGTLVLAELLDERCRRRLVTVLTASAGPRELANRDGPLPRRLANRLAAGLVLRLVPLPPDARRRLLELRTGEEGMTLGAETLDWLAERLRGARQVLGIVERLRLLADLHDSRLEQETVTAALSDLNETGRVSVERIAQQVSRLFEVDPRKLRSRLRHSAVLRPRQLSMYLARQLTGLSLEQIGACFGSRDHSTVLYACRKVERDLARDPQLACAVRELHAELL